MKINNNIKHIFPIAFPIAIQGLIQTSIGIIDQMMVSRLGNSAIAAAGLANHPMTVLFFLSLGIAGGTGIFAAQYYGDKQYKNISKVVQISHIYSLLITIPLMILTGLTPKLVLQLFTTDQEVILLGSNYLRIISISCIPFMITLINSSALKACGNVKLPFIAGVVSVIVNTSLNYIFIYSLGFGLKGAAIATLIARIIESFMLIYGYNMLNKKLKNKQKNSLNPSTTSRKFENKYVKNNYLKVTLPLVLGEFVFIASITFYTTLYARMGTIEMAAVTVLVPMQNITFGLFSGVSTAAAVLIGQALGNKNLEQAQTLAINILKTTFVLAIMLCSFFIVTMPFYINLFSLSSEVKSMTFALSWAIILFLPARIMNMILGDGILKSGGETKFMLKMSLFTLFGIGVPMGILTGFLFKLPLVYVYCAVSVEEIARCLIGLWKTKTGTWKVNLTQNKAAA
jgi:putative MATE family efflux protein